MNEKELQSALVRRWELAGKAELTREEGAELARLMAQTRAALREERRKWEADGRLLLSECSAEVEGERFKLRRGAEVVYNDHVACGYSARAWAILRGRPAKWKTVEMLRTVRQAVREMTAQGTGLEDPPVGASRLEVMHWLVVARHYDAIHHGEKTF